MDAVTLGMAQADAKKKFARIDGVARTMLAPGTPGTPMVVDWGKAAAAGYLTTSAPRPGPTATSPLGAPTKARPARSCCR